MASEILQLSGHTIDSLILPKVLDEIMDLSGTFEILDITIGKRKTDTSRARLRVEASSIRKLRTILQRIARLGASPIRVQEVELRRCPKDGVFPTRFYSTTNLPTDIYFRGRWRRTRGIEMDCGILLSPMKAHARCIPMARVRKGDWIVCGEDGIRVSPLERSR